MAGQPVVFHRDHSQEAGEKFPDDFFDWVYVDANHTYQFVVRDLRLYHRKVKPGGVLAGHDFCEKFAGVRKAVHEILNEGLCQLVGFTQEQKRSYAMTVIK
jgi:hypothetical protein